MAQNWNTGKTNDITFNTGTVPANLLPGGPAPGSPEDIRKNWGAENVQEQTNPLSTTAGATPMLASHVPAMFMRSGNPAATPPPATNPNTLMSGTMTLPGAPGAVAGIGPEGGIAENQAWKNAVATGNPGGTGQIPGVGGTLNVMTPEQNAAISAAPVAPAGGTSGQGEVWAGAQGQALRNQLTQNMNLAMQKANAPYTAERGTSAETGGNRQQWANLAKEFGDTLSGGMSAQGTEREAAAGHNIEASKFPYEEATKRAEAEYYAAHGRALEKSAGAREEIAGNQLDIAGLKANAGKYGNTAEMSDYAKGEGFVPNPQTIEALNAGGKVVKGTNPVTSWIPGRANIPATPKHIVPSDWKPTLDANGKPKITPEGLPLYTDAAGNTNRKPTIIGK